MVALGTGSPSLLPWLAAVSSPQLHSSSSWVLHPPRWAQPVTGGDTRGDRAQPPPTRFLSPRDSHTPSAAGPKLRAQQSSSQQGRKSTTSSLFLLKKGSEPCAKGSADTTRPVDETVIPSAPTLGKGCSSLHHPQHQAGCQSVPVRHHPFALWDIIPPLLGFGDLFLIFLE